MLPHEADPFLLMLFQVARNLVVDRDQRGLPPLIHEDWRLLLPTPTTSRLLLLLGQQAGVLLSLPGGRRSLERAFELAVLLLHLGELLLPTARLLLCRRGNGLFPYNP